MLPALVTVLATEPVHIVFRFFDHRLIRGQQLAANLATDLFWQFCFGYVLWILVCHTYTPADIYRLADHVIFMLKQACADRIENYQYDFRRSGFLSRMKARSQQLLVEEKACFSPRKPLPAR
jgi:hypothetical protein